MFFRPGFVTNSSSTGYYFFIPKDKEIYPDFFDEIGLTPIHGEDRTITKSDLYRDFVAAEAERACYLAELAARGDDEEVDWETRELSLEGLQDRIDNEVKWMRKDKEDERRRAVLLKERFPDLEEPPGSWSLSKYMVKCIKANSKLMGALKRGYRIVHIEYADADGGYSALMDYHGGHGGVLEKKDVGGVVTLNHH
jgi:hypothetical protein